MTASPSAPRPPDIGRRTLTPFGYAVCLVVPFLVAALAMALVWLNHDEDDVLEGRTVGLLTSEWEPGQGGDDALASGALTLGDDGCVLLGEQAVVWPKDFVATVERTTDGEVLRLYDAERAVVARGGDLVEVGGGYQDVGGLAGRACAPESGEVFHVQSDVTVVPAP